MPTKFNQVLMYSKLVAALRQASRFCSTRARVAWLTSLALGSQGSLAGLPLTDAEAPDNQLKLIRTCLRGYPVYPQIPKVWWCLSLPHNVFRTVLHCSIIDYILPWEVHVKLKAYRCWKLPFKSTSSCLALRLAIPQATLAEYPYNCDFVQLPPNQGWPCRLSLSVASD